METETTNEGDSPEGPDSLSEHREAALSESMKVLPNEGRAEGDPDLAIVEEESGERYLVELLTPTCECPETVILPRSGECKHVHRAKVAIGHQYIPRAVFDALDVDDDFGELSDGPFIKEPNGSTAAIE
ncbi:zinc finger SWIM domain-containing protein [Halorhabdus tiamatea SARL4B]|uniref:Zinc finger SWIM domain-containing protein n=1 Tax=Halorhabdus tiamatea SARL4B TaxID=1033806 RepID=U2DGE5_9EURY|nr:hypothetical protein [Halorhabdus tiamatea]ERJ05087.1 zinc finger SWIM domain-containing protein [Halorhabdus tiamatea SARL4B]